MFPFDRHTCKLRVGSYSNNDSKMKFRTEDVGGNTQMIPLDQEETRIDFGTLGNFSIAGMEATFTRHFPSNLMIYIYLPSGLFVVISILSTWIPVKDTFSH